jgi:hypothetical protein
MGAIDRPDHILYWKPYHGRGAFTVAPQLNSPDSPETAAHYHLAPFVTFLHEHYQRVATFSDHDEIWQRKFTEVLPVSPPEATIAD